MIYCLGFCVLASNWQKYIDVLQRENVPEKARRWYVVRVEQLLKAFPGTKLSQLSAAEIQSYIESLSRLPSLDDWQFSQAV